MTTIDRLKALIGGARDNASLRFGLGVEYLKAGQSAQAVEQFSECVSRDPLYSAGWKMLGRALEKDGQLLRALDAYRHGTDIAAEKGDKQAAKEMAVFARRLQNALTGRN